MLSAEHNSNPSRVNVASNCASINLFGNVRHVSAGLRNREMLLSSEQWIPTKSTDARIDATYNRTLLAPKPWFSVGKPTSALYN